MIKKNIRSTYKVYLCDRSEITDFVEKWHYSKSINGIMSTYCFKLMDGKELVGAAIFGKCGMANVWKKYASNPNEILELRRLCLIDDTPKNTETFFIGKMLRLLRANTTLKVIISYADQHHNHVGTIYKASNFSFEGETSQGLLIEYNGKTYHDKTIRTTYKGTLKPFAKRIKDALEAGEAKYIKTLPKNIYLFALN